MIEPVGSQEPTETPESPEPQEESADEAEAHDEDNIPEYERESEDESQGPTEPQEPQGLSEKEIEARFEKLDKEKQRHAKRVGEILEEEAQALVPCELCWPPAPGFRFPQMPKEQRSAVLSAIGFEPEPDLEEDKTARQCPDCKGFGKVKTGSKVAGFDAMTCQSCKGAGAVGERFAAIAPVAPQLPPETQANGETVLPTSTSEDAGLAQLLRDKGYTVMAPPVMPAT